MQHIDWGSAPQWLTFVSVLCGFYFTFRQLRHNELARQSSLLLSISDGLISHNSGVLGSDDAKRAIQALEGLLVPSKQSEAATYWAVRSVHLSHLNLIWRVWELAGRPERGKRIDSQFEGWQLFAREVIARKLEKSSEVVKNGGTLPNDLAASDIWLKLHVNGPVPPKFIGWLRGLVEGDSTSAPLEEPKTNNKTYHAVSGVSLGVLFVINAMLSIRVSNEGGSALIYIFVTTVVCAMLSIWSWTMLWSSGSERRRSRRSV